jgi:Icc-related predicted phosphoesterase
MKITCISDTHSLVRNSDSLKVLTDQLTGGEIIIHAGDMSSQGSATEVLLFLEWFSALPYTHKILIAGNHDWLFERDPGLANDLLENFPGITYLNDSEATIEGLRFWGSPITPFFNSWAFNRHSKEIGKHWDMIPEGIDVLVTHGPPAGILDTINNIHPPAGCQILRDAVARVKPKLHVFGHIHEGRGLKQVDETLYVNAAVLNGQYRLYNQETIVVDI